MSHKHTSMLYAVRDNDLKKLEQLWVEYGLDETLGEGYVLLREAAEKNNTKIATFLLNNGCKPNSKNNKRIRSKTPLHFAALNGNLKIIEMLVDHGANINAEDANGSYPIMGAIYRKHKDCIDYLLDRNAAISYDKEGNSPVHILTERLFANRNADVLEGFLKRNYYVNSKNNRGMTPLHNASENGNVEAINLLLNSHAEINVRSNDSFTPLYLAIKNNSEDNAAITLIKRGANIDDEFSNGETILSLAIGKGLSDVVESILSRSPKVVVENEINRRAFKFAAKYSHGKEDMVNNLLKFGFVIDPEDVNDYELFTNAVKNGYIKIIESVIQYGLNMTSDKEAIRAALHVAVQNNQRKSAEVLIAHNANVNAKDASGKSPLFYAVNKKDEPMVKFLILHGADVANSPELLFIAAGSQSKNLVAILIENKIDVNAFDDCGKTALHIIASNKYLSNDNKRSAEIADILLAAGAHVNARTLKEELTPLHYACEVNSYVNMELINHLLKYKANTNLRNKKGNSALQFAVENKHTDVVKLMLENGADVNIKVDGLTPLHIACEDKVADIFDMLLEHGADVNCYAEGFTPLHIAVKQNLDATMSLLLGKAYVNAQTPAGNTPLHIAINSMQTDIVEWLFKFGADVNIKNKNNHTPLDFAVQLLHRQPERNEKPNKNYYYKYRNNDYYSEYYESEDDYDYDDYEDERYYGYCFSSKDKKTLLIEKCLHHAVALDAIKLYKGINLNSLFPYTFEESRNLHKQKCNKEIEKLKSENVSKYKLSFYEILTMSIHSLSKYAKNEDIINTMEPSHKIINKFPIYASILAGRFRLACHRRHLFDEAHEVFKCYFQLPYECVDQILCYLSIDDLKNFNDSINVIL